MVSDAKCNIIQFDGVFSKPNVDIIIEEVPKRKRFKLKELNGEETRLPTLRDMETVSGKVIINLGRSKKFEHKGIKLELCGVIQGLKDAKERSRIPDKFCDYIVSISEDYIYKTK